MGGRSEVKRFAAAWTREFPDVKITAAEAAVLVVVSRGLRDPEVGEALSRSDNTVRSHFGNIAGRCGTTQRDIRHRLVFAMGREAGIDEASA